MDRLQRYRPEYSRVPSQTRFGQRSDSRRSQLHASAAHGISGRHSVGGCMERDPKQRRQALRRCGFWESWKNDGASRADARTAELCLAHGAPARSNLPERSDYGRIARLSGFPDGFRYLSVPTAPKLPLPLITINWVA